MALVPHINQDLTASMKAGDAPRTSVLRLLKNALQQEQIKVGHELTEPEALKVAAREAKQRKDSIAQYQEAGRADLADSERHELEIIETYLPQQMSKPDLEKLVEAVIAETGTTDKAQMGVVIGEVMKRAAGRADGAAVSQLVRQKLA